MATHKIGYIGFGSMVCHYHYETAMREDVDAEPVAVFDVRESQREEAKKRGLRAYDSVEAFLADGGFDFVVVGTSNNAHCEMVCRALEAGYNVMCEKPVAMNSAELQKMIDTAEKCGKLFTVHQNRRWDRDFLMVRKALSEKLIGKPFMIESRIHSSRGGGEMGGWRGFEDHGGGMLLDWGVHMLDQLLYLIQEPIDNVSAVIRDVKSEEVDDYTKIVITFQSGLAAQMEVATFALRPLPRWAVYGDEGAFTIDEIMSETMKVARLSKHNVEYTDEFAYPDGRVETRKQRHFKDEVEQFEYPPKEELPPQDWASLYQNVLGALDGKEELIVKPRQVMRVLKTIEAAFVSSKEGRSVKMDV